MLDVGRKVMEKSWLSNKISSRYAAGIWFSGIPRARDNGPEAQLISKLLRTWPTDLNITLIIVYLLHMIMLDISCPACMAQLLGLIARATN
jgi:hypothetical protein